MISKEVLPMFRLFNFLMSHMQRCKIQKKKLSAFSINHKEKIFWNISTYIGSICGRYFWYLHRMVMQITNASRVWLNIRISPKKSWNVGSIRFSKLLCKWYIYITLAGPDHLGARNPYPYILNLSRNCVKTFKHHAYWYSLVYEF